MSSPVAVPQPVIASVTGEDLLKRLDNISVAIAKLDDIPAKLHDHESRLRLLEQWRWKSAGIAAALSSVMSSGLTALVIANIHHH